MATAIPRGPQSGCSARVNVCSFALAARAEQSRKLDPQSLAAQSVGVLISGP
ncbi:MAG: hypothetical protein WCH39_13140 [Schlesneria sp.]